MEEKGDKIKLSREELTEALGIDIVPGTLRKSWNSLVAWKRNNLPLFGPLPLHPETGFMVRMVQQGEEEKSYLGNHEVGASLPLDRENNLGYYEIASGFSHKDVHLTLGMNNPKSTWNVNKEKQASPEFNEKSDAFVETTEALEFFINYEDQKTMSISLSGERLGVGNPEDKEQMVEALKAVGEVMKNIREGQTPDYTALREQLINDVGLEALEPLHLSVGYAERLGL